jgi:hypothetical protein
MPLLLAQRFTQRAPATTVVPGLVTPDQSTSRKLTHYPRSAWNEDSAAAFSLLW